MTNARTKAEARVAQTIKWNAVFTSAGEIAKSKGDSIAPSRYTVEQIAEVQEFIRRGVALGLAVDAKSPLAKATYEALTNQRKETD